MKDDNDWDLVARVQSGEVEAFAVLVRRYQDPVIQFCRRMVSSTHDAEELAQDCFVRIYRNLNRIKPQAKFSTLLFAIARNLALNHVRDAGRKGRSAGIPLDDIRTEDHSIRRPDGVAQLHEMETLLENALTLLSPDHREVLVLREFQGMDYDTIANVIGSNRGTVKSRLARAREQLRTHLSALGGELV